MFYLFSIIVSRLPCYLVLSRYSFLFSLLLLSLNTGTTTVICFAFLLSLLSFLSSRSPFLFPFFDPPSIFNCLPFLCRTPLFVKKEIGSTVVELFSSRFSRATFFFSIWCPPALFPVFVFCFPLPSSYKLSRFDPFLLFPLSSFFSLLFSLF